MITQKTPAKDCRGPQVNAFFVNGINEHLQSTVRSSEKSSIIQEMDQVQDELKKKCRWEFGLKNLRESDVFFTENSFCTK